MLQKQMKRWHFLWMRFSFRSYFQLWINLLKTKQSKFFKKYFWHVFDTSLGIETRILCEVIILQYPSFTDFYDVIQEMLCPNNFKIHTFPIFFNISKEGSKIMDLILEMNVRTYSNCTLYSHVYCHTINGHYNIFKCGSSVPHIESFNFLCWTFFIFSRSRPAFAFHWKETDVQCLMPLMAIACTHLNREFHFYFFVDTWVEFLWPTLAEGTCRIKSLKIGFLHYFINDLLNIV